MPKRKTPEDYHALARKRGFRWLGPEVPSVVAKTVWECGKGHRWEARYNDIQQGVGCPACSVERRARKQSKKPADYHALAEARGFCWLGPPVRNGRVKTNWACEKGHRWPACYQDIRAGTGCPTCAVERQAEQRRKKPEDYRALAAERGFRWLGPAVRNAQTRTNWECLQGHRWATSYSSIQQGRGCPTCATEAQAERLRKKPEDYHALARELGLRWLGPEVLKSGSKTVWECSQGHVWEAPYNNIQQGHGCPHCAGLAPKTPAQYHSLAEERGFRWLGPEVPNARTKTVWACEQGHQWEARFNDIQQGTGCPQCAHNVQKTPADYHALAQERGLRWLGPEVASVFDSTHWQCEQGHVWEARFHNIHYGGGCPVCIDVVHGARVSQVQRELCEMLNGELNRPCGRYNIDVALQREGTAIAVEYDSWYWHAHNQAYDDRRDEDLINLGWRVLRVKSNSLLPSRRLLERAVARLLADESKVEIILDDWGEGRTKVEIE